MPTKKPAAKKKKARGGVKVSSQTPVFGSIEDADMEEFTMCLTETPECISETNKNGWTPLHQAAYSGELEMLKALITAGAKLDATCQDGDTAVHYAAVQGELEWWGWPNTFADFGSFAVDANNRSHPVGPRNQPDAPGSE
jgi:ankyrin repeat protein